MVKMAALGSLLVAMAMLLLAGSTLAACPPQVPLNCASYLTEDQPVVTKLCCIELQNNFNLNTPTSSLAPWCQAVRGVRLFTSEGFSDNELKLALSLPKTCGLSGQFKKGQTCAGRLMPGGS